MDAAATRFQKVLQENNLTAQLTRPEVKFIENGGVIIEPQRLFIQFTDPKLEVANDQPKQPEQGADGAQATPAIPEKA